MRIAMLPIALLALLGCPSSEPDADTVPDETTDVDPPVQTTTPPETDTDGPELPTVDSSETGDTAISTVETADTGTTTGCTSLVFDSSWTYLQRNNAGFVASGTTELLMIPDNLTTASAAAVWSDALSVPFTLTFEYITNDDDGVLGAFSYNSADGLAIQFLQDPGVYGSQLPPDGGTLGMLVDGTGYALELRIFAERQLLITDANGGLLGGGPWPDVYTGPTWTSASISVDANQIEVVHGTQSFVVPVTVDTTYTGLVLSAATGGSDAAHGIRSLCLTQ